MQTQLKPGLIGQILLNKGFATWFLYMFRIIEGRDFIVNPIHTEMLSLFQSIYDGQKSRVTMNLCPRSSKTTMAKYFVVYSLTHNPRCQFIYTSFSQDLLSKIAKETSEILEHPIYKAMYSSFTRTSQTPSNPIDDFWREYLIKNDNKNVYTTRRITTAEGGVVLFTSIGSTITGFGCGVRGASSFSGALIIDDANKPADIRSEIMRRKVQTYFTETLFTRLNNSATPVINIQQRLHLEDLSGYLDEVYNFDTFKYPLLKDGVCTLPDQYTEERIKELMRDNYVFASQYQQEPIMEGGYLIKTEWFNIVDAAHIPAKFDVVYIVCDTAFTAKKSSDYSVFTLFGLIDEKRYIINCFYARLIYPELKRALIKFYNDACKQYYVSGIHIENKASGISMIQDLRLSGLPVSELEPIVHNMAAKRDQVADKYTRLQEVIADIESGYVYLPSSAPWLHEFLKQTESFTGGDQNYHDDIVDTLIYGLKIARKGINVNWNKIKEVFKTNLY